MLNARPELANMAMSYVDERRPIHFAVMNYLPEMVRICRRASSSLRYHRLEARQRPGLPDIVAIIEAEERRKTPPTGETPVQLEILGDEEARAAVAEGNTEWLRARHAAGTLTNPIRWDEGGLLTVAAQHDRPDVLKLFLDFGFANERVSGGGGDWVSYSQGYPLWHCAALGKRELAGILLARGPDPNVHVDSSGSAVYSAYSHKQWEMVELLQHNGGRSHRRHRGHLPADRLIREMLTSGNADPAEILRHGASGGGPEIVSMAPERIYWPADETRWFGILTEPLYFWHHIPWLYAGNKDFDRATYLTCFRLILNRCDPNVMGPFARTALHEVAAMRDHITEDETGTFTEALQHAGAEVGRRDDLLKSTALCWACRWVRVKVARLMLDYGADPVEADAEAWARPRAWAEKRRKSSNSCESTAADPTLRASAPDRGG